VRFSWRVDREAEEIARLKQQVAELQAENERLRRRVEELLRTPEEAQRTGKHHGVESPSREWSGLGFVSTSARCELCGGG
jgi:cell division protein FtsB